MKRLFKRTIRTSVKLPIAALWDLCSLGNMGEGSSTVKVLKEHQERKFMDDTLEVHEVLQNFNRKF